MVEAFIFDVFGTLVDWRTGVARETAKVFAAKNIEADAGAFADAWRARYAPSMNRIISGERPYVRLEQLHLENLEDALQALGIYGHFSAADKHALNRSWEMLPPWPDTCACLQRLKQEAIIAPCSNGSIAMMTRLARFGGLPWDAILGAEIAASYKPAAEVYLASARALNLPPEKVMMVAAHNGDLAAASAAGLKTGFFPRPGEHGPGGTRDPAPTGPWNAIGTDMSDFVAKALEVRHG